MFNKCRIGKQFSVRSSLLNATPRERDEDDQDKPEKASRYTEAEDEQPDKLFPQGGIHNGSEEFYRGMESQ